ncbi:MAG: PAS domain-containing protein, partial [Brachymonas sp.]
MDATPSFFFDQMPVGAYRAALDGRLLSVNPALASLLGFESVQEMLHARPTHMRCYAQPVRHGQFMAALYSGGVSDFDSVMLSKTGHLPVRERAQLVLDAQGVAKGYEGIVQSWPEAKTQSSAHAQVDAEQLLRLQVLMDTITDHVWM